MRDIPPAPMAPQSKAAPSSHNAPASPWVWLTTMTAALLASCAAPLPPAPAPVARPQAPVPAPAPAPAPAATVEHAGAVSVASSARDYRQDGAKHIYGKNGHRIYKGKMPPLLQGVGVMQLDLDSRGQIVAMNWLRPPSHAGARAEIERTVRAAAPFPAPQRMGRVTYTDTWLWHESGQFQLDTLTEGQRDR